MAMLPSLEFIAEEFNWINQRGWPQTWEDFESINVLSQWIYAHKGSKVYNELLPSIQNIISIASQQRWPLHQSLTDRAANQPLWYAWDYATIEGIYAWRDGWELPIDFFVPTDIGKKWDNFFNQHPAAQAVRNRKDYFIAAAVNALWKHPWEFHMLNIASWPITDIVDLYAWLPASDIDRLSITCVDSDSNAIKYAQKKVSKLSKEIQEKISFVEQNIFKLRPADLRPADLIWSAGLFDYFDDKWFQRVLKKIDFWLKQDWEIIVWNFNEEENPSRAYMEVFCNWTLIHRTPEQLLELAQQAWFFHASVWQEQLWVNLFLHVLKNKKK